MQRGVPCPLLFRAWRSTLADAGEDGRMYSLPLGDDDKPRYDLYVMRWTSRGFERRRIESVRRSPRECARQPEDRSRIPRPPRGFKNEGSVRHDEGNNGLNDKVSILTLDAQTRLDRIAEVSGEDVKSSRRRIDRVVRRAAQMVVWSYAPEFIHDVAQLAKTAKEMAEDKTLDPAVRLKAMDVFASLSSKIVDRVIPPLQRIRVSSSQFSGEEAPIGSVSLVAVHEAMEKVKSSPHLFKVLAVDVDHTVVRSGENATGDERAAG